MNVKFYLIILVSFFSLSAFGEKPENDNLKRDPANFSEPQKQNQMRQKDLERIRELKKDIQKILLTNKI
jgi:hypothetical protein